MNPNQPFTLESIRHGMVAELRMHLQPPGHIDIGLATELADTLQRLDADGACRVVLLTAAGKVFCAGADLGGAAGGRGGGGTELGLDAFYTQAMRLYRSRKPIVAAVQGPAIGAGMGLALVADFRVAGEAARFSANFCRLGLHPGFGMSVTLPRLVGEQQAAKLFYTGQRLDGETALRLGVVDELVPDEQLPERALALAQEIAQSSPLAVQSLRAGLAERIAEVNRRERQQQLVQVTTDDFREGVSAMAERRLPVFRGR